MGKRKDREALFATIYQIAGDLMLGDPVLDGAPTHHRTRGQRLLLRELLLDALSDPEHFTDEGLRSKYDLAIEAAAGCDEREAGIAGRSRCRVA